MKYTTQVTEKFKKAVSTYGMLDTDSVLVGFSGGADSAVLLDILSKHFKIPSKRLVALHINHMIRKDEAMRDAEFCKDFCQKRKIDFHCIEIDVPSACIRENMGTEECARKLRYKAFEDYCIEHKIDKIATAHNADDNIETVLFNLSRGTSLAGICGIPPVRNNIVRPLILCSKEEIIGYAKENGIDFVFDSTNDNTDYTRNYIRHQVVPKFKEINPSVLNCVSRFSQSARSDSEYLNKIASKFCDINDISTLSTLESPILHRVISMKFEHTTDYKLETVHIEAVANLIRLKKKNASVSLPCKMQAVITEKELIFRPQVSDSHKSFSIELKEGENIIDEDSSLIVLCNERDYLEKYNLSKQFLYKIFIQQAIDFDKINGRIIIRSKNDGDAYRYGKMTRKLKKLFNDSHMPLEQRATLPIVCDSSGIIWVPGFGVRDDCALSQSSENVYHLLYLKRS